MMRTARATAAAVGVFLAVQVLAAGRQACAANSIEQNIQVMEALANPAERGDDERMKQRLAAQRELAAAGEKAVRPLVDLIGRTKDDQVVIAALITLSQMKSPDDLRAADAAVRALLGHANPGVRYMAVKVLGVMKHREAAGEVVRLVADKEWSVRLIVADTLGEIGDAASVKPLLALADEDDKDPKTDDDKAIRVHATAALGRLGAAVDVMLKLIERLRLDDVNERDEAAKAVRELLGHDVTDDARWLMARTSEARRPVIDELEALWKKTVGDQQFAVPGASEEVRLRVNIALHQSWQKLPIRLKAIEVLRKLERSTPLKDRKSVDYLVDAMRGKTSEIRKAAAAAASELSGVRVELRAGEAEDQWLGRVDEFERRWRELKGGK